MPLFPLPFRPAEPYKGLRNKRAFGAWRSPERLHAACDLYAPVGTPVRAITDGTVVIEQRPFHLGSDAIAVLHPGIGLVRYCELQGLPAKAVPPLRNGTRVTAGQQLGTVGRLYGLKVSMLHFELYRNTLRGPLTVKENAPYQRRADLLDPTALLDSCTL